MSYYRTGNYDFKQTFSFQHRFDESSRILDKYPDRRPIICEKSNMRNNLPIIDKKKYLVPYNLTMSQFIYVIRQRMHLKSDEAIFLFVNNQIISGASIIGNIYETSKDTDGFLYIQYAKENMFG